MSGEYSQVKEIDGGRDRSLKRNVRRLSEPKTSQKVCLLLHLKP